MPLLAGMFLIIFGLISCFFGSRLYRYTMAMLGFTTAYLFVVPLLLVQGETLARVLALIVGVVFGLVSYYCYTYIYTLYGLLFGIGMATTLATVLNLGPVVLVMLSVVLGLIGALLGRPIGTYMVKASTAFNGAASIAVGVASVWSTLIVTPPLLDPVQGGFIDRVLGLSAMAVIVTLALAGFFYQRRADQRRTDSASPPPLRSEPTQP